MSLYKPGTDPLAPAVERPAWPDLESAAREAFAQAEAPADWPELDPAPPDHLTLRSEALNQVRLQAAQILQDAAAEAESALDAARDQGYEAGRQEGLAVGRAELESQRQQVEAQQVLVQAQGDLMRQAAQAEAKAIRAEAEAQAQTIVAEARQKATAILDEAHQEQIRRLDQAQTALVDLAVTAAVRLVQGQLALQPSSIVAMVSAGLRRLKDTHCTVRLSPQDLPLLEAQRSVLERELGSGQVQFHPDSGLSPGSYLVSSPQGHIDARVDQQAGHLRAALSAALGEG